ncbi:SAM-dependent methyltransferase [Streptomyces monticola]|uniref:SAM-dependent methyltransferase n=1 Tax=Streptomyces monticola TaxID=2666263 RepID=A0ABW2JSV6_9ACTN
MERAGLEAGTAGLDACGARGWRVAAEEALYGPAGFYLRPEGPAGHFRTSVHASPLFAAAVARLLCRVDAALGAPAELAFVDVGAGRGELTTGVLEALPAKVAARVRAYAVERAARPEALDDPRIEWTASLPHGVTGLLFANEWLDNVPLDVVETDARGVPRLVLVREDGSETQGPEPTPGGADARWLERWWPLGAEPGPHGESVARAEPGPHGEPGLREEPGARGEPGLRAEIGRPRDEAWASAVAGLERGLAVAVDYCHARVARPAFGTLTGFRDGRECRPVPDGSCDITAHVALDACARPDALLLTQREALAALGVSGGRPPLSLASTDPTAYVRALATAGEAAELTASGGLGDFGWLLQPVGLRAGAEPLLVDVADDEEQ